MQEGAQVSEAPYPATIRAKGWRFELDYERIEESDTWPLAAEIPMAQPALLMLWLQAWRQTPCGSLPDDDEAIRAKCRVPAPMWAAMRHVVMRGWWKADDGRLYHPQITKLVLEMMANRRSSADRQAKRRKPEAPTPSVPPAPFVPGTVGNGQGSTNPDGSIGQGSVAADPPAPPPDSANVTRDIRVSAPEVPPKCDTDHRPPTTKNTHTAAVIEAGEGATAADVVCGLMLNAGVKDAHPGDAQMLALLAIGVAPTEFESAAKVAKDAGKGMAYAIGVVKRRRFEALQVASSLPSPPPAPPAPKPPPDPALQTAAYLAEQAMHAHAVTSPEARAARLAVMARHGLAPAPPTAAASAATPGE